MTQPAPLFYEAVILPLPCLGGNIICRQADYQGFSKTGVLGGQKIASLIRSGC